VQTKKDRAPPASKISKANLLRRRIKARTKSAPASTTSSAPCCASAPVPRLHGNGRGNGHSQSNSGGRISDVQRAKQAHFDYLAHAAHEIRSPLSSLIGFSGLLLNFEFDDAYNNSGGCKVSNVIGNQNMIIALDDVEFHDKRISFIKLDVEGHELSCIEGMKELINKHKPLIWVEDYQEAAKEDGNNSIKFLLELGYLQLEFSPDANFLMKI
jgi:signal transduction histidine kinase